MSKSTPTRVPGSQRTPKKVKTESEAIKEVDENIEKWTEHRKKMVSDMGTNIKRKWTDLFSAAEGFLFGSSVVAERWECSLCTTDFRPMFVADPAARDVDFLYHCERCGASACFKCTLHLLQRNPLHETSVGFACSLCRFYNCNKISDSEIARNASIDAFPFCSGYSTLRDSKVKGEKLSTSKAILTNVDHVDNMLRQKATYDTFQAAPMLQQAEPDIIIRAGSRTSSGESDDYDPNDYILAYDSVGPTLTFESRQSQ